MTWTYAASTQARDQVRLRLGDTCSTAQLVSDEVIGQALTLTSSNILAASIMVAESQAAQVARQGQTVKVGDLSVSQGMGQAGWLAIAENLRRAQSRTVAPFVGGMGVTDKETRADDTTVTQPAFRRDLFTHGQGSTST